jgi:hypothetical protein
VNDKDLDEILLFQKCYLLFSKQIIQGIRRDNLSQKQKNMVQDSIQFNYNSLPKRLETSRILTIYIGEPLVAEIL